MLRAENLFLKRRGRMRQVQCGGLGKLFGDYCGSVVDSIGVMIFQYLGNIGQW
jgi:hypothetical protein